MSRTRWSATDLMSAEFPPPRWSIPGVIPEGLTLLVASPKFGKSWLALGLGASVASGGHAFGRIPVPAGDSLVLALEDPPRRLQQRLRLLLDGGPVPDRMDLWTTWHDIDEVDDWCRDHPDARYVAVDVLRKVRPPTLRGEDAYGADYRALEPFKDLAERHRIGVVVLHHVRKMKGEDFLDAVSGTNGLAGAADTIIVMDRARMTGNAVMRITGRDVAEDEHALAFDPKTGQWTMLDGPAVMHKVGDTRRVLLELLDEVGAVTPADAAKRTGLDPALVRQTLSRMAGDAQVYSLGNGRYAPLSHASLLSQDDVERDSGDTCDTPTRGADAA